MSTGANPLNRAGAVPEGERLLPRSSVKTDTPTHCNDQAGDVYGVDFEAHFMGREIGADPAADVVPEKSPSWTERAGAGLKMVLWGLLSGPAKLLSLIYKPSKAVVEEYKGKQTAVSDEIARLAGSVTQMTDVKATYIAEIGTIRRENEAEKIKLEPTQGKVLEKKDLDAKGTQVQKQGLDAKTIQALGAKVTKLDADIVNTQRIIEEKKKELGEIEEMNEMLALSAKIGKTFATPLVWALENFRIAQGKK